jgi:hypothetical protein
MGLSKFYQRARISRNAANAANAAPDIERLDIPAADDEDQFKVEKMGRIFPLAINFRVKGTIRLALLCAGAFIFCAAKYLKVIQLANAQVTAVPFFLQLDISKPRQRGHGRFQADGRGASIGWIHGFD